MDDAEHAEADEPDAVPPGRDAGAAGAPTGTRRYAVVGLGAIGGLYGARLAAAGHEVHFVARSDAAHVREHGLVVESPDGDVRLADVSVFERAEDVPPVDVVLLAVKTTDVEGAARLLRPLAGDGTAVVAMQNGLHVERPLAAALPGATVLGGMCFVCSNKVGPGHVRHLDFGAVTLGEHTEEPGGAGVTPWVRAIADDLVGAGVKAHTVDDLVTGRWRKLVWNIPYNGLSVVLDAGTDELMADPGTRALVRALMLEVTDAAAACGHEIPGSFVEDMLRTTDAMTPYKTSMKLDFEAGRPLELDTIYGVPLATAAEAGQPMPRTEALHAQLRFLDARRTG